MAEQLDLQANPQSISLFDEQIQTVKNKKNVFTTELKKLAENIYQAKKTRDNLQQEFDDLSNELSVLRAQKTISPARRLGSGRNCWIHRGHRTGNTLRRRTHQNKKQRSRLGIGY